jgi:hypothetical protein
MTREELKLGDRVRDPEQIDGLTSIPEGIVTDVFDAESKRAEDKTLVEIANLQRIQTSEILQLKLEATPVEYREPVGDAFLEDLRAHEGTEVYLAPEDRLNKVSDKELRYS